MKTGAGRNEHETITASFAKASFSSAGLFHPNLWGNGREPADLILKVGRSVFLFNMYRGRQWFETACLHNLDQAADRISEWRSGRPIRGANSFREFFIPWDDVDNVAVISVVDGEEVGCCHHHPDLVGHRDKLTSAVTLSGDVLRYMALNGGGARELVSLCSHLCATEGCLKPEDVIGELETFRRAIKKAAWDRRPSSFSASDLVNDAEELEAFDLAYGSMRGAYLAAGERPVRRRMI